jgi:hypothetical protein
MSSNTTYLCATQLVPLVLTASRTLKPCAAIPLDKKLSPKRALIVIGATVAGFLVGIFFALFQAGLQRIKNNSEAREKLHLFRSALLFRSSKSRLAAA